jgi:hypothetical protein
VYETDNLKLSGIDERIILKWTLRKLMFGRMKRGIIWLLAGSIDGLFKTR